MTTSLARERIRILSNYMNLIAGCLIGLLVTRILLSGGASLFGIYTIITVGMGVSIMLTELLRMGFVPVLGQYVSNGNVLVESEFQKYLTASIAISCLFAALGSFVMIVLGGFLLPRNVDESFQHAVWIFLLLRIFMMIVVVALTPFTSMLVIFGKQPIYNLILFFERMSELVGIAIPVYFLSGMEVNEAELLVKIGFGVSALTVITYLISLSIILIRNKQLRPVCSVFRKEHFFMIMRRIGWSSLQTISMNLYARSNVLIVGVFAGPAGAAALGIAIRLMGYVRQATMGLVNGIDGVFANSAGYKDHNGQLINNDNGNSERILCLSTGLQGVVVFQLAILMFFLGDDIVFLWVGDLVVDSDFNISDIVTLSILMVLGISFRSLNLGWMSAMTGSGKAKLFTPWLLPGAILNVIVLVGWGLWWPDHFSAVVVGWLFLLLQFFTHGFIIPFISSKALDINFIRLVNPLVGPAVFGLVAILLMAFWVYLAGSMVDLVRISGVVVIFCMTFLAGIFDVFNKQRY